MNQYKICKFTNGNDDVWYQILIVRPKLFGIFNRDYYYSHTYALSEYDEPYKYRTENAAIRDIKLLIHYEKSKQIKKVDCYEVNNDA